WLSGSCQPQSLKWFLDFDDHRLGAQSSSHHSRWRTSNTACYCNSTRGNPESVVPSQFLPPAHPRCPQYPVSWTQPPATADLQHCQSGPCNATRVDKQPGWEHLCCACQAGILSSG